MMWPCQAAMFIYGLEFLELQHFVQNEPAKSTAVHISDYTRETMPFPVHVFWIVYAFNDRLTLFPIYLSLFVVSTLWRR